MVQRRLLTWAMFLSALNGLQLFAADDVARFVEDVRPLLEAKCVSCHGPEKQEGNLRLDSGAAAKRGGDRGPAVVAGDVEKSLLVQAISFRDPDFQMPPKQKLSDKEIAALTAWVKTGAVWPEPAAVLFEDEPQFLAALASGNGTGRLIEDGVFSGKAAFGITPLQRDGVQIPGWSFAIRKTPQPGEYRYLRLAWKKRGAGSVMIELAADGKWPDAKVATGRYVAGPNTTGWAAISAGDAAPAEWSVATFDLWRDLGDFTLTGIAPTCDGGEEAYFDSIILGPTIASLDAYRPAVAPPTGPSDGDSFGDALTDERNPIRKLFRGERLDLWSLKRPSRTDFAPQPDRVSGRLPIEPVAPEADRRTLIRRLTFDLIGLPPTPDEVAAFAADESPDAYDNLVTRLLDSPRYGERQARHWLDVVRYADTNGYERDEFRPLAWQYRDYVIRSFNQDKPFDQFIVEQLAGDQLVAGAPKNSAEADMLIATGFLRLGQWDSTASIFQEEPRLRAEMLADLTNATASAFLGLTMSCCQCHDHKYDPLSQADHYRLRAFFAGVTARDDLPISLADEQSEIEDKKRPLRVAMGVTESTSPPATHVFYQGDFASPREEVQPGIPTLLGTLDRRGSHRDPTPDSRGSLREPTHFKPSNQLSDFRRLIAERSTTIDSRRLRLANWIASADNPWTARVIVNRIWQQHFGVGIVATPNDFGYSGARPTHPELLDWLAVEFMQRGWSIKELHRLIVRSAAYRQSSTVGDVPSRSAPSGIRQHVRRLDAETLRDALLAASGLLKPYDAGKPLWPPVPDELLKAQPAILEAEKGGDGGRMQGWYADPIEQTDVRSVFLVRKRCLPIPFLQAFDLPDTTVSCARRDTTVVAPQALMLLNSPEGVRCAQALAARVRETTDKLDFEEPAKAEPLVATLFQIALSRAPSAQESSLSIEFLKRHAQQHREAGDRASMRALTDLCRAIFNLNEFAYID
ncbi:MAG: PSD1 and planctomycete cytochrome C domain-containing protein [Pirellulales bacterium]